ncbi:M56 family metallopeptidase [Oceanihabitans sp.]|nr:M56 family metallopeptidase [Oceanihabitans sp.]
MALILLKSSACLLAFIAFYKVFLEHTSSHQFKRFYLLAVVLISMGIPFITFIEYIEPRFLIGDLSASLNIPIEASLPQKEAINYIPSILWSIYGFGVLLFSSRFIYNLIQLFLKINKNPKQKTASFISVLIQDFVVPHTFFNYIFFNKTKFENKEIPKEVILHEETHAKQKHSIDILFIELLQIIFWFNPLVYILKRDIKLNHEFLADQAVINRGINTSSYQQLILEFSSNSSTNHLANAINYSLIKKRFTVMKTKTSKQSLWLRSMLILPLLAILIYGFSTTKHVEREVIPKMTTTSENHQTENPVIKIQQNIPTINGIPCDNCTVNLSKDGVAKLVLGTTTNQEVLAFKIKFHGKPSHTIRGNKGLTNGALTQLAQVSYGQNIQIFDIKTREKGRLGPIGINIVNKDDKNYSHSPKVVKGERSDVPPPPAPKVVNGEHSNIPPPAIPANATPEKKAKYKKVVEEYKANQKELDLNKRELIDREKKMVERNLAVKERQIKMEEIKNIPPPPPVPEGATLEQKKKYEAKRLKYEESRHERMK